MSQRNWPGTYCKTPATRRRYCICWCLFHYDTDCHEVIMSYYSIGYITHSSRHELVQMLHDSWQIWLTRQIVHLFVKIHIHTRSLQRKKLHNMRWQTNSERFNLFLTWLCDDKQILNSYQWTSRILSVDLCKAGGSKQNFMDLEIGNDMVLTEWIRFHYSKLDEHIYISITEIKSRLFNNQLSVSWE